MKRFAAAILILAMALLSAGACAAEGNAVVPYPADTEVNTIYGVYNCAGCLTVMKTLGVDPAAADEVFANFIIKEGRNELFQLSQPCVINLIKNPTEGNEGGEEDADAEPPEESISNQK